MEVDPVLLAGVLDEAVDALLTARLAIGDLHDIEPPDEALDMALRTDDGHRVARRALDHFLQRVRDELGQDRGQMHLELEEAINEVASRATDVGYRLGVGLRER